MYIVCAARVVAVATKPHIKIIYVRVLFPHHFEDFERSSVTESGGSNVVNEWWANAAMDNLTSLKVRGVQ